MDDQDVLGEDADNENCPVCRQLRAEGPDEQLFAVAPLDGGGWHLWSAALLRYFRRVGHEPTVAMIIDQPSTCERYVQVLIGHGIAHAETSSNVYLEGASRLSVDQNELLAQLGWQEPRADRDDPDEMPANWSLPLINGDWLYLVEMLTATIVGVLGFREDQLVQVRSFAAGAPCRECSWPVDGKDEEASHGSSV